MKARAHIVILAAIIGVMPLASVGTPALAAGNPAVCDGFAQNYARKHSRGPIAGGVKRVTDYNTLYTQAYNSCMNG
jgi:hypothetical protein